MIQTAFILAAGFGTRMKPWTFYIPKPMLSLGCKPVILWHVEKLIEAGIQHIVINTHHLGAKLESFIEFFFDRMEKPLGTRLTILREESILGTGGALFQAKECISEDRFFLINSDIVYGVDLKKLAEYHRAHGGLATLVVRKTEVERLRQVSFGKTGQIEKIAHLPFSESPSPATHAFTGIHAIERRIFDYCLEKKEQCIIRNLYPAAHRNGEKLFAFESSDYWCDMGDLEGFEKLHRDWMEGKVGGKR